MLVGLCVRRFRLTAKIPHLPYAPSNYYRTIDLYSTSSTVGAVKLKDPSKAVSSKRRKKTEEKAVAEDGESSYSGPYVPFEGNKRNSSEVSIDKQESSKAGRFYHISSADGSSYVFPSVTTILDKTIQGSSHYSLLNWRKKLTKEHGVEGFERIRNRTLQSGAEFHQTLEKKLLQVASPNAAIRCSKLTSRNSTERTLKKPVEKNSSQSVTWPIVSSTAKDNGPGDNELEKEVLDSVGVHYMESVEHIVADISEVKALETPVAHLQLGYMGTLDCLAKYRGKLCLIDWKTSGKPKPLLADCYDYPLQAVAYAGAVNNDPSFNCKIRNVLIVIAYSDGEPAHAHLINQQLCQKYWLKWLERLWAYQSQFSEDLSEVISE